jgi:hypothetical protein
MNGDDTGIRQLELIVTETRIEWATLRGGVDDFVKRLDEDDEPHGLNERRKDTIELLVQLLELLTDLIRANPRGDNTEEVIQLYNRLLTVLGDQLYEILFVGKVETQLTALLEDPQVNLLRVQLEFRDPLSSVMSVWPWEYLHRPHKDKVPNTGVFLAREPRVQLMLNRRMSLHGQLVSLRTNQPCKILLVSASPDKMTKVRGNVVADKLEELAGKAGVTVVLQTLVDHPFEKSETWQATAVREKVREEVRTFAPHIIHYIGHGKKEQGVGKVALTQIDGQVDWVDEDEFALIAAASKNLKLVFMQACETALPDPYIGVSGVAQRLAHKNIPAVVAMQYKISKGDADLVAEHFYRELFQGKPIDLAVRAGREALLNLPKDKNDALHLAFGLPVLYLSSYEAMLPAGVRQQQEKMCPRCKGQLGTEFCTECQLRRFCEKCKTLFDNPKGKFCGKCGKSIVQPPWSVPEPALASEFLRAQEQEGGRSHG